MPEAKKTTKKPATKKTVKYNVAKPQINKPVKKKKGFKAWLKGLFG